MPSVPSEARLLDSEVTENVVNSRKHAIVLGKLRLPPELDLHSSSILHNDDVKRHHVVYFHLVFASA